VRLLFELSGEHPTLPAAEALAALGLQGAVREVARDTMVLVAEGAPSDVPALAARLGLAHTLGEHLATVPCQPAVILDAVKQAAPRVGPRFRVRAHRMGMLARGLVPSRLEREAGAALLEGRRVVLSGEADELRILLAERAHLGLKLADVDRTALDARAVRHRPFFSPISLHPRFARALVNLARVQAGQRVADPFCGTGGLLVEAGLLGARVAGADRDVEMVEGTRDTLAHFGLEAELVLGDVAESLARLAPLDAVVSDPPYGRASTTAREGRLRLYRRALAAMAKALRPGGRAALVFPDAEALRLAPPELALEQRHVQRVHRSLDRHYAVFARR
jgi:tRNA (guanine10-N2)-dimethyltransferase